MTDDKRMSASSTATLNELADKLDWYFRQPGAVRATIPVGLASDIIAALRNTPSSAEAATVADVLKPMSPEDGKLLRSAIQRTDLAWKLAQINLPEHPNTIDGKPVIGVDLARKILECIEHAASDSKGLDK